MKSSPVENKEPPARLKAELTDDLMLAVIRGSTDDLSSIVTPGVKRLQNMQNLLNKEELRVAAERAVEARLSHWRKKAEDCFATIAADLSENAARHVFASVADRQQGRPHKTRLRG